MSTKHMDEGYLLVFDFRKSGKKEQRAEWVEVGDGKRVFEAIV